jgi:hypothetical protein
VAREEVRFESGGESIAAWLFRPERAAAAAALPCVVTKRVPRGELRTYPGGHFDPFLGKTFERMLADQVEFLDRVLSS